MSDDSGNNPQQATGPDWYRATSKYGKSSIQKAIWQLVNTFVPYIALWALMVYLVQHGYSYGLILVFTVAAALLLLRIFIFFHDCCHGSFFASSRANRILGYVSGALTFTPFEKWQYLHAGHHATAGDLDRRGTGDVWTLTVEEYLAAPRLKRLGYRLFRHPLVMFGLGPAALFLISHRFFGKKDGKRQRDSVILTNIFIIIIFLAAGLTIGFRTYLLIQLPLFLIAGAFGVWLFYVQHQFEDVYWARHGAWDPIKAALEGSSYYRLPGVLQWFSGNIGLHHIHHVRPRIPNYNLQQCYNNTPALQAVKPLSFRGSLKSAGMKLWDEKQQKMVGFRSLPC